MPGERRLTLPTRLPGAPRPILAGEPFGGPARATCPHTGPGGRSRRLNAEVGAGKRTYSPRLSSVTLASDLILSCAPQGEASGPAVLLLPGPTDSWRSYQPVLDLLPDEIHAISVSQRGHGESDKPAAECAVEDFAADVVLLLDALAID